MRVIADIIIGLLGGVVLVGTYLLGLAVGTRRNYTARLRNLGLTRASADLYTRAVRIMNRLLQLSDLDGALAGDTLSTETKKLVADWLIDHKEAIKNA